MKVYQAIIQLVLGFLRSLGTSEHVLESNPVHLGATVSFPVQSGDDMPLVRRGLLQETSVSSSESSDGVPPANRPPRTAELANVTVVNNPAELVAAFRRGDEHIEIQEHISLVFSPSREVLEGGGRVLDSISSIRGNCRGVPPYAVTTAGGPQSIPLLPRQCLLVIHATSELSPLHIGNADTGPKGGRSLWVDGLHVQYRNIPTKVDVTHFWDSVLQIGAHSKVWMTNMTLESDREMQKSTGMLVKGQLYAEGSTFAACNGAHTIQISGLGDVVLTNCRFQSNRVIHGLVEGNTVNPQIGAVRVQLENVSFSGNFFDSRLTNRGDAPPSFLRVETESNPGAVLFYSDRSLAVISADGSDWKQLWETTTEPLSEWPSLVGLSADDPFLTSLQKTLPRIDRSAPVHTPTPLQPITHSTRLSQTVEPETSLPTAGAWCLGGKDIGMPRPTAFLYAPILLFAAFLCCGVLLVWHRRRRIWLPTHIHKPRARPDHPEEEVLLLTAEHSAEDGTEHSSEGSEEPSEASNAAHEPTESFTQLASLELESAVVPLPFWVVFRKYARLVGMW